MNRDSLLRKINIAQKLIQEDRRFNECIIILKEILSNIPTDYQYRIIDGDTEYIEFWDNVEFMEYTAYVKKTGSKLNVVWTGNIYPKACYFIAVAFLETNDISSAEKYLQIGLSLEKDNPLLLNEMGMLNTYKAKAFNDLSYYKEGIKYFRKAFDSRPYITKTLKARALRGIGFCEIELQNFDNAEKYFKESLEYEESGIAMNELLYIKMAKKGLKVPATSNLSGGPSFKEIKNVNNTSETEKPNKLKSFFKNFLKN
jgi:tetratricopeptide (TPR) repeat protein